ncbi:repeat-containing protein [Desulfotomaculum arcticum]|uniref:Repeat-containing protein n=1 Tax=Desulfotruncus arcticus DSM 17038 TaxID=1121424 RepID=A0A1I2X9Q5_9FIRM|nr:S-layer homology domain-containing protein [Desulfotruncus arcticus]SFH10264.1 repeat-containing protein [Desulfotomaculum arcticum] [Desulfotruncus arcticus DSM 17038]
MSKRYTTRHYPCLIILFSMLMLLSSLLSSVPAASAANAPVVVSAGTDHLGKIITLQLDKPMADPAGSQAQFAVSVNGTDKQVTGVSPGSNANQILLSLASLVTYSDTPGTITVSYTKGTVAAADGTLLESFTNLGVTNNVIQLELVDYEPAATEIACADDPTGGKIVKYRLNDRMDYDDVNLAIYFTNGFFRNFADNLADYVRFYNKDTGAEVELPNILTEPVPFEGSLPDRYMEYTDWYFKQIQGRAPLGLALKSRALEPDTTYVVEVLKGFAFHTGPISSTFSFEFTTTADSQTKPYWAPGSSLTTAGLTDTSLTLEWPTAQDNHGLDYENLHYNIYQNGTLLTTVDGAINSYQVTNLTPATDYQFKVEAVDFADNLSTNNLQTTVKTTGGGTLNPLLSLNKNSAVVGADVTASGLSDPNKWVSIKVLVSVQNIVFFDAVKSNASGNYSDTFKVPEVDPGILTVVAGYDSNVASADLTVTSTAPSDILAPTWPTGNSLTASAVTRIGLTLTWSTATDNVGVTGYRIYKDGTLLDSVSGSTLSYHVTGLTAATTYTFKVEAGDAAGKWSTDGPETSATTTASGDGGGNGGDTEAPTWPANAKVTVSRNQTEATLTWPKATDNIGVTGYRIERDGVELDTVDDNTTTYDDSGLERGNNTYVWSVEARDAVGNWSTAITGQSLPGQNPLSFIADQSSLTIVSGDNSTDDGPIEGSTTVPVDPTIRIYFDRGVTTDAVWSHNKGCISLQDSTGSNVSIKVFRLGSTDSINDNLHYIFLTPTSDLTPGKTYKIIISKNMTANNGHTLGENNGNEDEVVTFTVTETSTPTVDSNSGTATVSSDQNARVSLGDDAVVDISAGALQETDAEVKIQKVASPPTAPEGAKPASDVYEFTVGGKQTYSFAKSVTLTFKFNAAAIGADETPAIHYYDESKGKWVNIGGTVSESTITVQVNHFTKYTVFAVKKTANVPVVEQSSITLNDIAVHWAENSIKELVALGAVSGYPDGSFKPDNKITRAEFVSILVKAFKLAPRKDKVFADTAEHWAKDTIATASYYGIVSGYDANTFGPNDPITREQMAAMIVKAAKLTLVTEEITFKDSGSISDWARSSMATAIKNGIINGYDDKTVRPLAYATRAEAVSVIINALSNNQQD